MNKVYDLTGKVAVITGASKGIGESIARNLVENGASVVISSRSQEAVDAVADQLRSEGHLAIGIACHVGDEAQLRTLVDKTVAHYGGIDILINNAATNPTYAPIDQTDAGLFDKIFEVNVRACHLLANLCHPIMKSRGGGSIINIASVEGLRPSVGLGLYSVSKAALIMLTKSQAKEWGPVGIRSNAICPGLIQTKFSKALWSDEKLLKTVERHLPLKRMAQPEEMNGIALLLASDAGSYMTGGVYTADGGHLLIG